MAQVINPVAAEPKRFHGNQIVNADIDDILRYLRQLNNRRKECLDTQGMSAERFEMAERTKANFKFLGEKTKTKSSRCIVLQHFVIETRHNARPKIDHCLIFAYEGANPGRFIIATSIHNHAYDEPGMLSFTSAETYLSNREKIAEFVKNYPKLVPQVFEIANKIVECSDLLSEDPDSFFRPLL